MEVGLGLRNIVFDVDPASPRKKGTPPLRNFGPCLLWPNGWMDEELSLPALSDSRSIKC